MKTRERPKGHIAVDDTPVPVWGKGPHYDRSLDSLEITAGMYAKGGAQKRPVQPGNRTSTPTNTGTRRGTANKPASRKGKAPQEKKAEVPEKKEFRYA
ncbi:hypothetical protein ABT186_30610 [Streptomyces sp. NPDC001634]|uniref:hypothetical protein n=1 Tax=Streptomyces sp. NPDC001634 TaxID=3154390 RepID=UPI00332D4C02